MGVRIREFTIFSFRACYRSVCNHPFLAGLVLFLIFLGRSFPFVFSILVSASPVLVCTAALLGTLLSFGNPNIPEIEKDEKTTHEIVSLRTGVSRDATVVEKDESYSVERYTETLRDLVEQPEEVSLIANNIDEDDRLVDSVHPSEVKLQYENKVIEEAAREIHDLGFEQSVMNETKLNNEDFVQNHYFQIERMHKENLELENDISEGVPFDYQRVEDLDSSPASPTKQKEEVEEEDDEGSESGSDRAESSSPDASMTDIIPMLDELHPLLDEEAPQPAHVSLDGSDAGSGHALRSVDGSERSDADSETQEHLAGGDDDNDDDDDDDEEEEEEHINKDNAIKSAITWTEDDQKNLMDLGTSELERNLRLESLIARRRARKSLRVMAEKNLIDLESGDLSFNIAPISTTRNNPFDMPYDSNNNMELPPIPGSAPSILLPRRNPFDLPYDSSEEKPDLTEDPFQHEFLTFQPKEPFFRRHESFNVGPSLFGISRQEKQDVKFRPYFVPERMPYERTSYSSFQRQSSELSESKASSIPETESMVSVEELEDKKIIADDFSQQFDLISSIEHDSEHIGHGSESSEDLETEQSVAAEKGDDELDDVAVNTGDVKNHHGTTSSLSETVNAANPVEPNTGEIYLNAEAVEEENTNRSSSSSFSEVNAIIFTHKEDDGLSTLEATGDNRSNIIEVNGLPTQPSLEDSAVSITSRSVDDTQQKEPVYDSSPPAVKKNLSSASIYSDQCDEVSEIGLPKILAEGIVSSAEMESEVYNEGMVKDTFSSKDIADDSFSGVDRSFETESASMVSHDVLHNSLVNQKLSADIPVTADLKDQDNGYQNTEGLFSSLSSTSHIYAVVHEDEDEKVDSSASSHTLKPSEDQVLAVPQETPNSFNADQVVPSHSNTSYLEIESKEKNLIDKEVATIIEQDHDLSSNANANFDISVREADEKLLSMDDRCAYEDKAVGENDSLLSDKSVDLPPYEARDQLKEGSAIMVDKFQEASIANDLGVSEVEDTDYQISGPTPLSSTSETAYFPTEVHETSAPTGSADREDNLVDGVKNDDRILGFEEFNFPTEASDSHADEPCKIEYADEMKEIDERLLLELDTVGDFSFVGESLLQKTELSLRNSEVPLNVHMEVESESGIPVARSLEEINALLNRTGEKEIEKPVEVELLYAEFIPDESMAKSSESGAPHQSSNPLETKVELPVIEATSVEEINLAFKQVEDGIHPDSIVDGRNDMAGNDQAETPSEFPVDKRALEESVTTSKQASEINLESALNADSEEGFAEVEGDKVVAMDIGSIDKEIGDDKTSTGIIAQRPDHELPVIEVTSVEETKLAFKQVGEGFHPDSIGDGPNDVAGQAETPSEFLVDERALEESVNTSMQASLKADSQKRSAEVEGDKVGAMDIGSIDKEIGDGETSTGIAQRPDHEVPVIEATSVEEINLAFKQVGEGIHPDSIGDGPNDVAGNDQAETPSEFPVGERALEESVNTSEQASLKADSEKRSVEVEGDKVGAMDIGSTDKEIGDDKTSPGIGQRRDHEVESSEDMSSMSSDVKGKKEISHESSSSSSSSSDSDKERE